MDSEDSPEPSEPDMSELSEDLHTTRSEDSELTGNDFRDTRSSTSENYESGGFLQEYESDGSEWHGCPEGDEGDPNNEPELEVDDLF